jgi:hypothetical protein
MDGIVYGPGVPKIPVEATARLPKTEYILPSASHQKRQMLGAQRILQVFSVPLRHDVFNTVTDCGNVVYGISGPNQHVNMRRHNDISPNAVNVQRFAIRQCPQQEFVPGATHLLFPSVRAPGASALWRK